MELKARYKFIYQSLNAASTRMKNAQAHLIELQGDCTDEVIELREVINKVEKLHTKYRKLHLKEKFF